MSRWIAVFSLSTGLLFLAWLLWSALLWLCSICQKRFLLQRKPKKRS